MRKLMYFIVALALVSPAFAEPTRFGSETGVVVGSQSQEVSSGYTISGGDLYVADELYVSGAETHAGAVSNTGTVTNSGMMISSGKRVITPATSLNLDKAASLVVSSEFMVVSTTGVVTMTSTPFISTSTSVNPNGTRVEIINGGTSAFTLQDKGTLTNSCLSLGGSTRVLGAGDTIILKIYNGIWSEFAYTNNQ